MADSDPFDWSVDRVIYEFCQNPQPAWFRNVPRMTRVAALRQVLEDNDIRGDILLFEFTQQILKDDLGIKSLGQRYDIMRAIECLRSLSNKYQLQQQSATLNRPSASITAGFISPQVTHSNISAYPFSPHPHLTAEARSGFASPSRNSVPDTPLFTATPAHQQSYTPLVIPTEATPAMMLQEPLRPLPHTEHTEIHKEFATELSSVGLDINPALSNHAQDNAGTNVEVEAEAEPPVAASNKNKSYTIVNGRKRVAPTFISHSIRDVAVVSKLDDDRRLQYDGLRPDEVFYPEHVPEDEDDQFEITQSEHSMGQRLFVAHLLKSYLLQPIQKLPNSSALAKIPYNRSLLYADEPQHFTMFIPGLEPAVHDLAHWPALTLQRRSRQRETSYQESLAVPTETDFFAQDGPERKENDDEYDYLLNKYPPTDEHDDIGYELYGDSGDDGEYDAETWNEIQQDIRDANQESLQAFMSKAEIGAAIDEAIEDIKASWRISKMDKTRIKGYHMWMKTKRTQQRQDKMDYCNHWIGRFDQGIKRMRETIIKDTWHRSGEVKQQCRIFEESVEQREENLYFVAILADLEPPSKPDVVAYRAKQRGPRPDLQDGEELLESDSDDLGEFVLDDSSDEGSIPHDIPQFADAREFQRLEEFPKPSDPILDLALENRMPATIHEAEAPAPAILELEHEAEIPETTPEVGEYVPISAMEDHERKFNDMDETESPSDDGTDDMIVSSARRVTTSRRLPSTPKQTVEDPTGSEEASDKEEEEDSVQDSDLDATPRLPRSRYSRAGMNKLVPIVLSSPSATTPAAERTEPESSTDHDVRTPELNPNRNTPVLQRLKLKGPKIEDRPQDSSSPARLKLNHFPALGDIAGIQGVKWALLEDRSDSRRILAKAVYNLPTTDASKLQSHVSRLAYSDGRSRNVAKRDPESDGVDTRLGDQVRVGLQAIQNKSRIIEGMSEIPSKQRRVRLLSLLYASYACETNLMDEKNVAEHALDDVYEELSTGLRNFFECLLEVLGYYCTASAVKRQGTKRKISDEEDPFLEHAPVRSSKSDTDGEEIQEGNTIGHSAHKKRKRKVTQNEVALSQQRDDQQRIHDEEERTALVHLRIAKMGVSSGDPAGHAIGVRDPIVFLHEHMGKRVKPHQIDGIRFMWREITGDKKQQGCLLAHTMGLGKTMQVISLLVTIVLAAKSKSTQDQVPEHMRESKTLILCPPSLIDNWFDEILMWRPQKRMLGDIFKIVSTSQLLVRLQDIRTWAVKGGVLIISYEMFRGLILNERHKLNEEDFVQVKQDLLESPAIIVADEAHKMKNADSKITQVAKRFKSTSRIALTGSPLANNLEEYHTMIDWIAPGYLGTMVQYKDKYTEPISAGLYEDSTSHEKRLSLRKLITLGRDLEPKLHRAGITAIAKDMPAKTEYFITLPLTTAQVKAYNIYVNSLLSTNDHRSTNNTKLWQWLHVLGLLCNHPSPFYNKLDEQRYAEEAPASPSRKKAIAGTDDSQGDALPTDVVLAEVGLSKGMIEDALKPFRKLDDDDKLEDAIHSNRSLVVQQIVKECMRVGDKVLIFSHTIPTLNYLEKMLKNMECKVCRIDGETKMSTRQETTKVFNKEDSGFHVFLISMRAGGLGLNLQGANRVVVYDFGFNPTWEEQAIGRAYRLGQRKPVFVYRFRAGGTFEDVTYNKAVFKTTLFSRVVDKKNYMSQAKRDLSAYLFPVRDVEQQDLNESLGRDPEVLDKIVARTRCIRNIELTETFQKEDLEELTPEEMQQAVEEYHDQKMQRDDPQAYAIKQARKAAQNQKLTTGIAGRAAQTATVAQPFNSHANTQVISPLPAVPQNVALTDVNQSTEMLGPKSTYFTQEQAAVFGHRAPNDVPTGSPPSNTAAFRSNRASSAEPRPVPQTDGSNDDFEPSVTAQRRNKEEPLEECKTQ